jgi:hypothetical protein
MLSSQVMVTARLAVLCFLISLIAAAQAIAHADFLRPATATITSSGSLAPRVLEFHAGTAAPSWLNLDATAHVISFANGRCTFTLDPGGRSGCSDPFWHYAGAYRYEVSGISSRSGVVRVDPADRSISIAASRGTVEPADKVVLAGHLRAEVGPLLDLPPVARAVSVFARTKGHRFTRVGRATTTTANANGIPWRFTVHPKRTTAYQARAWGEPRGDTVWRRASSRTVVVRVR